MLHHGGVAQVRLWKRFGVTRAGDCRVRQVPDESFTVADVARTVGEDVLIRPIHVGAQANIDQVSLWVSYGVAGVESAQPVAWDTLARRRPKCCTGRRVDALRLRCQAC